MTTPVLKPTLPAGAILSQHAEQDFNDFHEGRPLTQRMIVSIVQVGGTTNRSLDAGRSKKSQYETVHAYEVTDPHQVDELRHRMMQSKAEAGFLARQPALFDSTEEEQRESLLDMIRDWASEHDRPMDEVDRDFVDYFGGADNASSESVQACRSVLQLKEFAYHVGVITDPVIGAPPGPAAAAGDDPSDDGFDDEPTGEGTVPAPGFSGGAT